MYIYTCKREKREEWCLASTRLALVRDVAFVKVKTGIEDGFPPLNLRKVLESLPGVDVYGQTCVSDAWQVCAVRIDEGERR